MKGKEEPVVFPESFTILGADLGLNRPGFALLSVKNGSISGTETCCVDNKTKKTNKPRGQILSEIADTLKTLLKEKPLILVREASINNAAFGKRSGTAARTGISEVVGVCDLIAWQEERTWEELYPVSVKKLVTGSGKSDKAQVAQALDDYVGKREYDCDDESDAAAVALAWLIKNEIVKPVEREEGT